MKYGKFMNCDYYKIRRVEVEGFKKGWESYWAHGFKGLIWTQRSNHASDHHTN